jgi:hypothetical protein
MITSNPELQRYGWLEFSLHRLVAMPVVLGIILFIALQSDENSKISDIPAVYTYTSYIFGTIFFLLVGLWGGHKAAESVIEEINDNTWDFQRLSSLSPWQLTIGKWLGSTSYCWYGGLMAFAIHTWANSFILPAPYALYNAVLLFIGGLICHAVALLSSLQIVQQRAATRAKLRAIWHHIVGLGIGWSFIGFRAEQWRILNDVNTLTWYGDRYDMTVFMTGFAAFILLWLVAGIYWQMRAQLRMRTNPLLWAGFVAFIMLFFGGFEVGFIERYAVMFGPSVAFFVGLTCCYGMVFMEPWSGLSYHRLKSDWQQKNWANVFDSFPRWLVAFILAALALAWIGLMHSDSPLVVLTLLAMLVFAVRDIALLHYFKFNPESRRATATALFYLGILYLLIPPLIGALHIQGAIRFFLPIGLAMDDVGISLASGLVQTTLLFILALRRWRRYWL